MQPLPSLIGNALPLPRDASLKVYHVSTPPTPSPPIFKAKPGAQEDATFCESHFLAISVPSPQDSELLALALEVLIYTTSTLTTIFISKADTTGYLYLDKIPKDRDVSKIILKEFVQHLLEARREHGQKLILSLFARAQNQYLFPGSIDNKRKRILPDRELLRWWCRVLDPVLRSSENATAHVLVAGAQMADTKRYVYPPSVEDDLATKQRWSWSYPTETIAPDPSAPTQCLLPRFPDDPKTRFQEELDEQVAKHGKWTSPSTLDEFWAMMSYRRECYEGRSVGFLWMVFPAAEKSSLVNGEAKEKENLALENGNEAASLPTPAHSQPPLENADNVHAGGASEADAASLVAIMPPASSPKLPSAPARNVSEPSRAAPKTTSPHPSSPSLPAAPVPKPEDGQKFYDTARKQLVRWPAGSKGELVLSEEQYQLLMDHLLQLDFSDQDLSHESTKSWISKAAVLASSGSGWGVEIKGTGQVDKDVFSKKRKADSVEAGAEATQLSAGLIRKKSKVKA
jgi:regulator of Ty1 transposition protein 109